MLQVVDEFFKEINEILLKAFDKDRSEGQIPFAVDDEQNTLTSAQCISLLLKAPCRLPNLDKIRLGGYCSSPGSANSPPAKRFKLSENHYNLLAERYQEELIRCPRCPGAFQSPKHLASHMAAQHSPHSSSPHSTPPGPSRSPAEYHTDAPPPYKPVATQARKGTRCMFCNIVFKSSDQLSVHISSAHRNQNSYNCISNATCTLVFPDIPSLKTHVYEVHMKQCPVCRTKFTQSSLAQHVIETHGDCATCCICRQQFNSGDEMVAHTQAEHLKPTPAVIKPEPTSPPPTTTPQIKQEQDCETSCDDKDS